MSTLIPPIPPLPAPPMMPIASAQPAVIALGGLGGSVSEIVGSATTKAAPYLATYTWPPPAPSPVFTAVVPSTLKFDFKDGKGPVAAHKHPNGFGWVADTAKVSSTAYVGPLSQVYDNAVVGERANITGRSRISGFAKVRDRARISNSEIRGESIVTDNSVVRGSMLFGSSYVADRSKIGWSTLKNLKITGNSTIKYVKGGVSDFVVKLHDRDITNSAEFDAAFAAATPAEHKSPPIQLAPTSANPVVPSQVLVKSLVDQIAKEATKLAEVKSYLVSYPTGYTTTLSPGKFRLGSIIESFAPKKALPKLTPTPALVPKLESVFEKSMSDRELDQALDEMLEEDFSTDVAPVSIAYDHHTPANKTIFGMVLAGAILSSLTGKKRFTKKPSVVTQKSQQVVQEVVSVAH